MKSLLCLLILIAVPIDAAAQDKGERGAQSPSLSVGEAVWTEVPITYVSGSPFSGGVSNVYKGARSHPPHSRAAIASAYPKTHYRESALLPSWRAASVELTNAGAKEVRAVRLDFVFTDASSGAEVLRLGAHARTRLRVGESKLLKKTVKGASRSRRGDGALMSVEIKEVVYADGSVWMPGAGR